MTAVAGARSDLALMAALLLLCGIAGAGIFEATLELEQANQRRADQLRLMIAKVGRPQELMLGPLAALDGLFVRRLHGVATEIGPAIDFVGDPGERP